MLEAVGFSQVAFQQDAEATCFQFRGATDPAVHAVLTIGPIQAAEENGGFFRNRCGEEVDGTTRGVRAEHDLAIAFDHFHSTHPPDRRKVVGRRRCIRRGGGEDTVFHDGDFRATGRVDAAETDIGKVSVTVFTPHINTGYAVEDAVDVVVGLVVDFAQVEIGTRARAVQDGSQVTEDDTTTNDWIEGRLDPFHDGGGQYGRIFRSRLLRKVDTSLLIGRGVRERVTVADAVLAVTVVKRFLRVDGPTNSCCAEQRRKHKLP